MTASSGAAKRIDVHHHILSPRYRAERERHGVMTGPGFESALDWTPEKSLQAMDETGIETAILSSTSNWSAFPPALAPELARDANEFAAGLRRQHPARFGFFAALPMPDVERSLEEMAYAFDVLGADGISTTTNFGDRWPGDAAFDAVFEELNRRRAVVFVHPQAPKATTRITPPVPDATVEFMFDIVRCITAMLYRGTFTRFPEIRFIFTHGGGGLPALAERIDRNSQNQPAVAARLPHGASHELRKLFLDVTTSAAGPAMAGLRAFMPTSQLLFGSDFPFMRPAATAASLDANDFDSEAQFAINRGNAERLFPRLRATPAP